MLFKTTIKTGGDGLWSNKVKKVNCRYLDLVLFDETPGSADFGELRVYFDNTTWLPIKDGLIYTDNAFLRELKKDLIAFGLDGNDVEYSEQGMQGCNYVSCDVGRPFIESWHTKENAKDVELNNLYIEAWGYLHRCQELYMRLGKKP